MVAAVLAQGFFDRESGDDPEISEAATGEAHADTPTLGGGMCNIYTSDGTFVWITQDILTAGTWYKSVTVVDTVTAGGIKLTSGGDLVVYTTTGTKTAT